MPNFIKIKEIFVDGQKDGHLRPALLGRLWRVDLKSKNYEVNFNLHSQKKCCKINKETALNIEEIMWIHKPQYFWRAGNIHGEVPRMLNLEAELNTAHGQGWQLLSVSAHKYRNPVT